MRRREHGDRGAAAVEFALVVPVLVLLLFGMIDYGLYFTNRLAVQQGAHAAAREAAIAQTSSGPPGCTDRNWVGTPNLPTQRLGCVIADGTRPVVGTIYVKVVPPAGLWKKGKTLKICEMVKTDGLTGFVPLPDGGVVNSRSVVAIEQDRSVPDTPEAAEEILPSGLSWSWCTAP